MKKLFAILLAMMLVLSMSAVAFAEVTQDTAPIVPKTYKVNNGTAPAETFTFAFEGQSYVNGDGDEVADAVIPEIDDVTISFGSISAESSLTANASVDPDDYNLGVYTYKVTESSGNTAGVTYSDEELYLVLTVVRDELSDKHYFAAMHYESVKGDKLTGFTNEYDSGSLSVTKYITGNMADMDKEFAFTITLSAPAGKTVKSAITVTKPDNTTETITFADGASTYTYEIDLGHGQTVRFDNLPAGVTYTISEDNENYEQVNEQYSDDTKTISANDVDTYEITNKLEKGVDTGITIDSLPYIMLLGFVVLAGAVMMKRRMANND